MTIETGKGHISLLTLIAIWSVSAVTSLPGLAISPILDELNHIFPKASELEVQMLTSLPSLLIIPFVLLSGVLSVRRSSLRLLYVGLAIFFASGIWCLVAHSIRTLIAASCLLGVGAGMVIPLSTGLVVRYFTGDYRVRQLGYSSAINNLMLVAATAAVGYLANANWHLPFAVYLISGVSLLLVVALRNTPPAEEPPKSDQLKHSTIHAPRLTRLTALYFTITYAVLAIAFYLSYRAEQLHISSSVAGVITSIFFLAIMLPGFFLGTIIRHLRGTTNIVALVLIALGLFVTGTGITTEVITLGVVLAGLGYGIMQPIIYDKAAIIAPPQQATKALAVVMTANYVAIVCCPFVIDALRHLVDGKGESFPFLLNGAVAAMTAFIALFNHGGFVLGLDKSYYEEGK